MTTNYVVKIKDNSIPEHMRFEGMLPGEYTSIIENISTSNELTVKLQELIFDYAQELDTDPEMIEILLVTKSE